MPDRRDWIDPLRERLASLGLDPAREAEIVEELSLHLEQRYDDLRADGATADDARQRAIAELLEGPELANALRPLRQARVSRVSTPAVRTRSIGDVWQDVRYSLRLARRQPGFTIAAVLMLAFGIGATTAIFTVVNSILIKPLPYPDSSALVRVVHRIGGIEQPFFSDAIYLAYRRHASTLQDVGAWAPGATVTVTGAGEPEEVRALNATHTVLTTLGVRPIAGRWFTAREDVPGGADVVMITGGYWQRRFGADPHVLERTLTLNGQPHRIVGVMPADFRFGRDEFDVIIPLRIDESAPSSIFRLLGIARLEPGVTLEQANADALRALHVEFDRNSTPPDVRARWAAQLRPAKQEVVGDIGTTLWVLLGAIGIVFVMACANLANLLLVRADGRRHEMAVRAALGARWTRMARQLLVESLVLALAGGVAGVLVAYGALKALVAIGPVNLPRLAEIAIDPAALAFAVAISLLSALTFGLVPIVRYARPRMVTAIVSGRGGGPTRRHQRSQQVLVAAQLALAVVLLVSAGLMIRTFQAMRSVDPGFVRPAHVLTFSHSLPPAVAREPQRVGRLQQQLVDALAAIPGVDSVAFATRVPMGPGRNSSALSAEGRPDDGRTPPNRHAKIVSPGLFRTLGTPMVAGRDFTWTDLDDGRQVAIVSENLAREFWGSPAAAIGKRVREYYDNKSPWREVIGVVGSVYDDGVQQEAPATIYWPAAPVQRTFGLNGYQPRRVTIVVRSEQAGSAALLARVRDAVQAITPAVPVARVATLDEMYRDSMARTSFTLVLLAIAGTMSLLLGISGIYGVISYAVSQQRREIGIRLALGAQAGQVCGLFVRRGLLLGAAGVVAGLIAASGLTRVMRSLLFGVEPLDPVAFTAMPLVLAATGLLASYLPARRAMTVNPVETMRVD